MIFFKCSNFYHFIQPKQNRKYLLTFDRLVYLLKNIVISDDQEHYSHLLVPKLAQALSSDQRIKPPHEVLRNYDYNEMNNLYSNLSEWKTLDIKFVNSNLSAKTQGRLF